MIIGIDLRCLDDEISSGVSVYTYNLLKNLLFIDNKNYYKIFTNRQKVGKFFSDLSNKNFKFYSFNIPNKLFNFSLKFFKFPKIDKLISGVDIFWLPNINFIALSSKCKLITTVHDVSFKTMPELFSIKRKIWHKLINPQRIFKKSEIIISVSENTKNDLEKFYNLESNKIKVIYPGVEELLNQEKELGLKTHKFKYGLSHNLILSVATLEPRKNIESIILSFEKLLQKHPELKQDNWQLVIVGKRGWLDKSIFKILKKVKHQKYIKYFNNISWQQLPLFYQSAKIFIWPSYYEGFGFPPLEALKFNLPIITSANSSLAEVLENKVIFINPFNVQELAKALEVLIFNIERYKKDYSFKLDQYTWRKSAENLLKTINNV